MSYEESVEIQEVAEPEVETISEENPEVAEPESGKTDADTAFAQMRREKQQAEAEVKKIKQELAKLQAEKNARQETVLALGGEVNSDMSALAEVMGLNPEDVMATLDAKTESALKDLEIESLKAEINNSRAEKQLLDDLSEIKSIDPNVNALFELGDDYIAYRASGLSPTQSYWAIKGKESAMNYTPPKSIGKINKEQPEKDYYTEAEVSAMSSEERYKNADKIMKSFSKWKK